MKRFLLTAAMTSLSLSGYSESGGTSAPIRLAMLQPQHFHAALVQKHPHPALDSKVHLYAETSASVKGYTDLIKSYNSAKDNPTTWTVSEYFGADYLQKMLAEKKGNVVVLAGNNRRKIEYMTAAIKGGFDVFADKPFVISPEGYNELKNLFAQADSNGAMIYDMMTERHDVKNQIIKSLINNHSFSGGFAKDKSLPAITFKSVHHFLKTVSGKPLVRPAWFFDTEQQGEGLVDVTTHYIDLVQWMIASEQIIDVAEDIKLYEAKRSVTKLTREQFSKITGESDYPDYLRKNVDANGTLSLYSNGEIGYDFKGVPVNVSVSWNVESLDGKGDQFTAEFILANWELRVKPDKDGKLSVFARPTANLTDAQAPLEKALQEITHLPGLSAIKEGDEFKIIIPEQLYLAHEDHFSKVVETFIEYKRQGSIPPWEKSFILAKYWLTTEALKMAKSSPNK